MDHSGSMTSLNPRGPITGNYLESLMLGIWNLPSFSQWIEVYFVHEMKHVLHTPGSYSDSLFVQALLQM